MSSKDYPKVPTTREQITTTVVILIISLSIFPFLDFDIGLSPYWKRYITRAGGLLVLAGGVLGGFGFLWNKKNKVKLTMAQQDFNAHTVATAVLRAQAQISGTNLQLSIDALQRECDAAGKAIAAATSFEDTVAAVGIFALVLLTVSTIIQVVAV